jgi:hypothetical protein
MLLAVLLSFTSAVYPSNTLQLKENAKNGMSREMRKTAWPLLACASELSKSFPKLYEVRLVQRHRLCGFLCIVGLSISCCCNVGGPWSTTA